MDRPFDILDLVARAYRTLYDERAYLVRLAAVPVFIILMNFIIVSLVFPDLSPLRRGVTMMPALVAEAWMVAQFLRTLLTRERWPLRLPENFSGPIPPALFARARGLLSCLIYYLLVSVGVNVVAGVLMTLMIRAKESGVQDIAQALPPGVSLAFFLGLLVVMLNFRLIWIYIGLVVNMPIRIYLQATRRPILNFQLLALWFATLIPPMFASLILLRPLLDIGSGEDILSFLVYLVTAFISIVVQMVIVLATSTAMTLALAPLLFNGKTGA